MRVLRVGGDGPSPDFDPDEDVAHCDEDHGENVTEDEVSYNEVQDFADGVGPDVQAEAYVGVVVEDHYEVEEEHPGRGDEDGEDPDEDDHQPRTAFGDLAFQRPPDG